MIVPVNVQIPTGDPLRQRFYVDHKLPGWFAEELTARIGESDQPGRWFAGGWIRRRTHGFYVIDLRFVASKERPDSPRLRELLTPLLALPLLDPGEIKGRLKAEHIEEARLLKELVDPPDLGTGTNLRLPRRAPA